MVGKCNTSYVMSGDRLLGLTGLIRDTSTRSAYELPSNTPAGSTKTDRKPVEISDLSLAIGFVGCIAVLVALHRVSKRTSFTSSPGGNAAFICIGIGFATGFAVYGVFRYAESLSKKVSLPDSEEVVLTEDSVRPSADHVLHPCRTGEKFWVLKADALKQSLAANACSDAKHSHLYLGKVYSNRIGSSQAKYNKLSRLPETVKRFIWVQRITGNPLMYVDDKLFAGVSPGEDSMAAAIQAVAAYVGESVEVYTQLRDLADLPPETAKEGVASRLAASHTENFVNAPSPLQNSGTCILNDSGKLLARKCDERSTEFQFDGERIRAGDMCVTSDGMDVGMETCDESNRDQVFVRDGGEIRHEQSDKCLLSTQSTFSGKQVEMGECGDPAESWAPVGRVLKTKDGKCLSGTGIALFNGKCDGEWQVIDGHVYHTETGKCLYGQTGSDRLGFAECGDAEGQLFDDRDGYLRNKLADRCIAFTQLDQAFFANCETDTNNRVLYQTQEGSEVAESTAPERVMFRHKDTQKCLSAKEGEFYAQCAAGDPAMEWSMKDYQLKADGKCLGVCGGKPVMRSCNRDNTEWRLDDVGHLIHVDTNLCLGVDEMADCERAGHFDASVL